MSYLVQCNTCQKWYANKRGLLVHLKYCTERHTNQQDNGDHLFLDHNPLKSCYDQGEHRDPWAVYDNELDELSIEENLSADDRGDSNDEDNQSDSYQNEDSFGQSSTAISKVQIRLNDLINRHKAPLLLYDEIVHLFNDYISSDNFSKYGKLCTRQSFIKQLEKSHPSVTALRPVNKLVTLHDDTQVTVPVFDIQAMILDILTNPELMREENFAEGYDIFTGEIDDNHPSNLNYGEIHTGDEWTPARNKYCQSPNDMPIGIVIFGDKSHTDLHGALSLTPIIFTLTLFNVKSRNNPKFWRVIGYLPNLGYGKNKSNKTSTVNKVQDEHNCLSCVFESIRRIHKNGGFKTTVLGQDVNVKIWIHYFIGDTEGNNKWLGHYQGSNPGVSRPYRDCTCSFDELSNPNPTCVYVTINEMRDAMQELRNSNDVGMLIFKKLSRHPIKNALTINHMPLSDMIHGPSAMMPPELLHASMAGMLKYIFQSMQLYIGATKIRDEIDKMHVRMLLDVKRQSDRDLPRGSMRNGIIDDTKCQAEERKGNLFLLLCIGSTVLGGDKLQKALRYDDRTFKKWLQFIKLYLSMEQWMHDSNPKEEVTHARPLIGKVLRSLQNLFPREGTGNEYNIPKMHAMTKFQFYMKRYGSAINFYGGTGESAHKFFVKAPGLKTQRRVTEFASQVANQYYNMLVTTKALRSVDIYDKSIQIRGNHDLLQLTSDSNFSDDYVDDMQYNLSGRYSIQLTESVTEKASRGEGIYPQWKTNLNGVKNNNYKYRLHSRLVNAIINRMKSNVVNTVEGFTRLTTESQDGNQVIYHANPHFQGRMWYDWAYVHFEEHMTNAEVIERYYPAKILGFVKFDGKTEAVIQCSTKPLRWSRLKKQFVVEVILGIDDEVSVVTVPLSSLVHPLCVVPNYGGHGTSYLVILPRRNWSRYFGDKVLNE